ncbi:MAG: hypothetical protein PHD15_04575 [Clostridia bacterium]|nr:hypothetical protein [Clostridia bacterium]MDD4387015.1 hypothetical protein [Clostridia bacterium]
MNIKDCKDTRYYIDLDLKNSKIINYGFDDRKVLSQDLNNQYFQRVFITKGQYNKLLGKINLINNI